MKIKNSQNRSDATVFLIPCFETDAKSIVGISFQDISIASKVFYGKKILITVYTKTTKRTFL